MIGEFYGNAAVVAALEQMIVSGRIPQALLLAGPEGVGKATLARRFAAALLPDGARIELDDLSRPENQAVLAEREKWPAEHRVQDPLLFGSHPDFLTFPPDGPLRQISIQQMRTLKERAQFAPLRGNRRVFLVDQADRANEQAANSLLKTLEEPPPYLILILTAENPYDLLPTIRSRSVLLHLAPLAPAEIAAFVRQRGLSQPERRAALAGGSPGMAISLDLEAWDRRRAAMLALVKAACGAAPFAAWAPHADKIAAARSEKLDGYLKVLYSLLEDLLQVRTRGESAPLRNIDLRQEYDALAPRISFEWLVRATARVDEIAGLLRRNIQKSIALDALLLDLR